MTFIIIVVVDDGGKGDFNFQIHFKTNLVMFPFLFHRMLPSYPQKGFKFAIFFSVKPLVKTY